MSVTSTVLAKKVTKTVGDYTEYVGTLDHANFVVRIPNKKGMLVVGCHGYMMNWNPNAQFAMDNLPLGGGVSLPFALVGQGFAYAASSYGEGGFPIKEAMIRTHQLTEYVIGKFGVTGKVFIVGHSMGGAIALLLGEKFPKLYDGVLDISGMKDIVMGYAGAVAFTNGPIFPTLPPEDQAIFLQMIMDMEAQYGGTYDDKPQHYERLNPTSNAEISIPMTSVNGAQDIISPPQQTHSFENAVAEAGCSEYYRLYIVPTGNHANPPTINAALSHFAELVDYPDGW